MKRKLMAVTTILMIVLIASAFSCHKAATTSRGVAASLVALQDSEITLYQQGKVTSDEHRRLQQGFIVLATTGQQVNKCIGNGGGPQCVDIATTAVDQLIASPAVAGIKNPDSKAAITLAAKTLEASLVILKGAL